MSGTNTLMIVTVNVSQTVAPAPSTLQRTGYCVSQGGTSLAAGSVSNIITQMSDLTAILAGSITISTIAWASGTATVTTATPHGYAMSSTISVTIAGAVPAGYNGTNLQATITGASTFTYPLATNPGSNTTGGTVTDADVAELVQMGTTYFAQGSGVGFYVFECGAVASTAAIAVLTSYLTANPFTVYALLVPREWDANSAFLTLIASYESPTSKLYFFVTTSGNTYTSYTNLMKNVFALIEAPTLNSTAEFSCAAPFYVFINYAPSSSNLVTPFAFSFLYGVTPYPTKSNASLRSTLKAANINIIGTGSEGGITNTILLWGTLMSGVDATWWYSIDWVQLNLDLDISNAIINGSNNPLNPLYYNQQGINRLQAVAQNTMTRGVAFGLVLATTPGVTVGAIPFNTYVVQNPSDFPIGRYAGLSVSYTPNRGFISIVFNLNVTSFPLT